MSKRTATATAAAYAHAKERLLDGRFAPGVLLSENELARELGISRTPVREAFLLLEAEGLLELYPRRGALVTPISPTEVDDVLEARLLIETHCAAAVTAPNADLDAVLADAIARQERSLDEVGDGSDENSPAHVFNVADRDFHETIVNFHGNPILGADYAALRDRQARIAANAVARSRERIERFIAEHRGIASALAAGDGARASALVTEHLIGAHELARRPRPT